MSVDKWNKTKATNFRKHTTLIELILYVTNKQQEWYIYHIKNK